MSACASTSNPYRFIARAWFDLVRAIEDGCAGVHGLRFGHAYDCGTPVHSVSASNIQAIALAYVDAVWPPTWPEHAVALARVNGLAIAVADMWRFFSVCAASAPSAPCQQQQGLCWGATFKPPTHPWPPPPTTAARWAEMSGALEALEP